MTHVTRKAVVAFGANFAAQLKTDTAICVVGGVFSAGSLGGEEKDDLWPLSMGEDVELSGKCVLAGGVVELKQYVEQNALGKLQALVYPPDPRFDIVQTEDRGKTVVAAEDIPSGTDIGIYHGYIRGSTESSNEHYNGSMLGVDLLQTVDPTLATDDVVIELWNCVPPRVNEPPPECEMNVKWVLRTRLPPLQRTVKDVKKGDELFIFYGEGYAPIRDWKINPNCVWID